MLENSLSGGAEADVLHQVGEGEGVGGSARGTFFAENEKNFVSLKKVCIFANSLRAQK